MRALTSSQTKPLHANILDQKGLLTPEELAKKMKEVAAQHSTQ
jgi:hypothetical protein